MAVASTTAPVKDRGKGRGLFWAGIGLCLLGLALFAVQFLLIKMLFVPWYTPAMATVGALLLVWSIARRRSIPRIIGLVLIAGLAAYEWYLLGLAVKLPEYTGPAQAGQRLPAFQTTLADGRALTDQDLRDGRFSVLTFFRGRW